MGRVCPPHKYTFGLYAGQVFNADNIALFNFTLKYSKRSICISSFNYADITHQMRFKPTELIEWSPAILLNCTNYRTVLRYLSASLAIFFEENPKCMLTLPF